MKQFFTISLLLICILGWGQEYFNNTPRTYNGYDYDYYVKQHERANKGARIGMFISLSGVGIFALSTAVLVSNPEDNATIAVSGVGFLYSLFAFKFGIPIWMVNAAKSKANRKVMEKFHKPGFSGINEIALGRTDTPNCFQKGNFQS